MAIKKNSKPHSSTRKKTAASNTKRAQSAAKTKKPKNNTERPAWLKKRDELTLKIFQWAYEANQRGEFQRL